jgi:hypothetical protein
MFAQYALAAVERRVATIDSGNRPSNRELCAILKNKGRGNRDSIR